MQQQPLDMCQSATGSGTSSACRGSRFAQPPNPNPGGRLSLRLINVFSLDVLNYCAPVSAGLVILDSAMQALVQIHNLAFSNSPTSAE
eukprot:14644131-Alexandrium_andersonii.AAC.1